MHEFKYPIKVKIKYTELPQFTKAYLGVAQRNLVMQPKTRKLYQQR